MQEHGCYGSAVVIKSKSQIESNTKYNLYLFTAKADWFYVLH